MPKKILRIKKVAEKWDYVFFHQKADENEQRETFFRSNITMVNVLFIENNNKTYIYFHLHYDDET